MNAMGMISMMMRNEDGDELQFFAAQILNNRRGSTWIYNSRMRLIMDNPDIIVSKSRYRIND